MIADTFIRRPNTAIVISIVIVLVGLLSMSSLPISQYPNISPPVVSVTATYTGADAQTIEQTVATPIEIQVNGVPGMDYIQTANTSSGVMNMSVNFQIGTDVDIAALDVQNRAAIAAPLLPQEVSRLGVVVRKRSPTILLLVALFSPKGTHSVPFMDNYANIYLRDALLRVPGVGDVISRADDFSMRVWMKPDKLAQYKLTAGDITNALQEQNVQVAAGAVGAPPQPGGQPFEYNVYVNGRLNQVSDFENIIVKTDPATHSLIYLKDVARVELGKFAYASNSFVDGRPASYLLVYQTPSSNALQVASGIYATMTELKKSFPYDVDYVVPFESVSVVKVSIDEVETTLLEALGLVVLVVFLFLQSWRATLIPVLAIPVSIIGAFAFFIPLGFSINTLTLFGFVLAIGIVVDDAIVVVEAVQHYMDEQHLSPRDATIHAMKDISGPVVAIALILAAVFVPVGFTPGIVGRMYQQFAITIAVSVVISAFVALSLTPALCLLILKPMHIAKDSTGINKFFYWFNRSFNRFTIRYTLIVRRAIKVWPVIVALLIGIFIVTALLFKAKPTGFIPQEDEGRVYITFELQEATSTVRSLQTLLRMQKVLAADSNAVAHFAALGGYNVLTGAAKSNSGTIFCQLKPWDQRKADSLKSDAIVADLQRKFSMVAKEANVVVIQPPAIPGLGASAGFTFMLEQKSGNGDIQEFSKVLQNYLAAVNKRPEIGRAFSFFTARTPGYQVTVNREKCKQLGIAVSDVFTAMQTMMGSQYVNDLTLYGRTFHVVAQADTTYRDNIAEMGNYYVRNNEGAMIPLSTVISSRVVESAPLITHFNLFRCAEVDGTAKPGFSSGQAIQALKEVADQTLPVGYGYEFSGLSRQEVTQGSSGTYIFAISIVFVFLFLAALYESWSVPFSVLMAVPIGAFGAIIALVCKPAISNSVYAQIGLVTLIGLAAKNAILIVEFAKERVDSGMELIQATLDAVRVRLRPILMTSLAFILGVMPLVLATGAGAVSRQTIGITVLGGMLAATGLAIFFVPVLFVLIMRIAYRKEFARRKG
ncbi:efflux RND transporter permease subunit [Dinghuibacter silviterrae]|uniref:HAE1 family hydrophobic/amphiphilic exporter-1 n=1 Tax=Dinghuibacter silviterrae TaxID=1539049 RepID=A0A4R8DEL2_9BACT|nr:efflux RND transporter permease subunit [Dinghuibacter silviterrae]TDW95993.1 HAE1 family hydrophobic/amphiphilic exporter-1 [Dinghuibacter silviterrae]